MKEKPTAFCIVVLHVTVAVRVQVHVAAFIVCGVGDARGENTGNGQDDRSTEKTHPTVGSLHHEHGGFLGVVVVVPNRSL